MFFNFSSLLCNKPPPPNHAILYHLNTKYNFTFDLVWDMFLLLLIIHVPIFQPHWTSLQSSYPNCSLVVTILTSRKMAVG